jgi:uncharacterized protein YcbX
MIVTSLHRYPVKGLGGEALAEIFLDPFSPLPGDRRFAFARPGSPAHAAEHIARLADPSLLGGPLRSPWAGLRKQHFLQWMQDEALAALAARFDTTRSVLTLSHSDGAAVEGEVTLPEGRARLEQAVAAVCGLREAPRLVFAPGLAFADSAPKGPPGMARISLVNRASLAEFGARIGAFVAAERFRANIVIDGVPPWAEFGWVGGRVQIGEATFRVEKRIDRCPATEVDPQTARRDLPVPKLLHAHYGHIDCGVYLQAESGGFVAAGAPLRPLG